MKRIPVVTLHKDHQLDRLVLPYLSHFTDTVMISYHYAAQHQGPWPSLKRMVDSGGYASVFEGSCIHQDGEVHVLEHQGTVLHPEQVLRFQEQVADVAFTLDFMLKGDSGDRRLFEATLNNARWAAKCRSGNPAMQLYGSLQAWDAETAREAAQTYRSLALDGIAVGGLVPHASNEKHLREVLTAVRDTAPELPLHVFGLGHPRHLPLLTELGVSSVDSSSYVRTALSGHRWRDGSRTEGPSVFEALELALDNLRFWNLM